MPLILAYLKVTTKIKNMMIPHYKVFLETDYEHIVLCDDFILFHIWDVLFSDTSVFVVRIFQCDEPLVLK